MENYKENLITEQKELKKRLSKLTDFINSEEYYKLSPNNKLVLKDQKIAMELYLQILNIRAFEDVDFTTIPDYGFMQAFGMAFTGNGFGNQEFFNKLKKETDNTENN